MGPRKRTPVMFFFVPPGTLGKTPGYSAEGVSLLEGAIVAYVVKAGSIEWNPGPERLRDLTEKMPISAVTEIGNVVVMARVDSRSSKSTYIVEDSTNTTKQTITRAEYDRVAAVQEDYLAHEDVVVVDGYIGSDPEVRTRARLGGGAAGAGGAGMQ